MKVNKEQRYACPMQKVFEAFCDQALLEQKLQFLGSRKIDVRKMERSADGIAIEVTREVPAEAPSMLKKFIADWNTLHQKEKWTIGKGEISGTFQIELEGIPVQVGGTFRLVDEGDATLHQVEMTADSRIPLVGKKLAEFVGRKSEEALQNEFDFWLDNLKA